MKQIYILLRIPIVVVVLCVSQTFAQQRRALLVGINNYRSALSPNKDAVPHRLGLKNLNGSINDVDAMYQLLVARYEFDPNNIVILKDQEATRERILLELKRHLINRSSSGDVALFFYAGHGSQIRNTKSERGVDETLVPADAGAGARDIRDKELAQLYNQVLAKGSVLTVITDACYSGSLARGLPSERLFRMIPTLEADVADPAVVSPSPAEQGALIWAACQEYEGAEERQMDTLYHGVFSHALIKVLRDAPVGESTVRLYTRLVAYMKSCGYAQDPVLSGTEERKRQQLFGGEPNGASGKTVIAILRVNSANDIELHGGLALGLRERCTLKMSGVSTGKPDRILVTEITGVTRSRGKLLEGTTQSMKPGDLFEIEKFAVANDPLLNVWIPTSLGEHELQQVVAELKRIRQSAKIRWISDPTVDAPMFTLELLAGEWHLMAAGGADKRLGTTLSADKVLGELENKEAVTIFANIPPSTDFAESLRSRFDQKDNIIRLTTLQNNATYLLAGRYDGGETQYAWILPNVSRGEIATDFPLPLCTDWIASDDTSIPTTVQKLDEYAKRLGRIAGWLQLSNPEDMGRFDYRLALKNTTTSEMKTAGTVREGESYNMVLQADETRPCRERRYVYVFIIDSHGRCQLLFPPAAFGTENYFPRDDPGSVPPPKEIRLPGVVAVVDTPLGTDTYFLLTTAEPLDDPTVLESQGVRSRSKGLAHPLGRLINDVGVARRGDPYILPTNWSVERLTLRSVGKK